MTRLQRIKQFKHKVKMHLSVWGILGVATIIAIICGRINSYELDLKLHTQQVYAFYPTPTPSKPLTHEDIVLNAKHGDILYRIWTNETTRGINKTDDPTALHTYCAKRGMTNEFGFNPQGKQCFKTFQESVDRVNQWWDVCLKNNTLEDCLHLYSGNTPTYVNKFLNQ